jgi:hypothetical protein
MGLYCTWNNVENSFFFIILQLFAFEYRRAIIPSLLIAELKVMFIQNVSNFN